MLRKSVSSSNGSASKRKPWIDPDDAPELTDEMLDRAEIRIGGRIVQRGRPPIGDAAKNAVTLRLDTDVLESYRSLGAGWQTRLNADLRRVRKLKPLPRSKSPAKSPAKSSAKSPKPAPSRRKTG